MATTDVRATHIGNSTWCIVTTPLWEREKSKGRPLEPRQGRPLHPLSRRSLVVSALVTFIGKWGRSQGTALEPSYESSLILLLLVDPLFHLLDSSPETAHWSSWSGLASRCSGSPNQSRRGSEPLALGRPMHRSQQMTNMG